ncbi:hypothetical protein DFH07DRAFT_999409, partial [Mycena maculata]
MLVFIALSWRLTLNGTAPGLAGRSQSLIHGTNLPIMSKVLLQNGQLFYLTTVSFNILTLVMGIAPSISPTFHGIFPMPNIALENGMACRVFRALRLGLLRPDSDSDLTTWRSLVGTASQPNRRTPARSSNITLGGLTMHQRASDLNMPMTKKVDTDEGGSQEDSLTKKVSHSSIV